MTTSMKYIFCVGDSLTFGARDEFHSSYPAELSRIYWEKRKESVHCLNFGISGETSGQLLRRINSNSKSCPQANVALILIGTNDTRLPQRADIYRDNMRQCLSVLKQNHRHVGVGLLPPLMGPGLPNYPTNAQELLSTFNDIVVETAAERDCFTADFRELGEFIIDTAHFNHMGYRRMAEIWFQKLTALNLEL